MYKGGGEGRSNGRQWEHEHGDSSRAVVTFYPEVAKAFLGQYLKPGPAIPIPMTNPPNS